MRALFVFCCLFAFPSYGSDVIYRCARDFDGVLGSYLSINDNAWANYSADFGPQDWHYADSDEILTNYNNAEYIRTWWDGASEVRLTARDPVDAQYRLWIWARDEPGRDMAVLVSTNHDTTSRIAAHEDREGWYDCGVVQVKWQYRIFDTAIQIRKATIDRPDSWSLVKAIYLTTDTTDTPPAFEAEARSVPADLGGYTYNSPNRIDKDWVLQWPHERLPTRWITVSPDSLTSLRNVLARPEIALVMQTIVNRADAYTWDPANAFWMQGNWTHYPHAVTNAVAYLVTGDTLYAQKARLPLIAHMRQHALAFNRRPPSGESWHRHNNTLARFSRQCLQVYDIIAPAGVFSPQEDRELRALFAFLAYYMEGHGDGKLGAYVSTGGGYWWWNGNTDRYTSVGLTGMLFPDHPRSAQWIANAEAGFDAQMNHNVQPGGTWPESSNYALVTMVAISTYLLGIERTEAGDETLLQERVRRFYDWHVRTTSPTIPTWWANALHLAGPDGNFHQYMRENWIHLDDTVRISQGTGESAFNNGYGSQLLTAAALYQEADPELSARLKWAWKSWGGQLLADTHADLITNVVGMARALDIEPVEPVRTSERIDGYVVLRDRPGEPEEITLFIDAQLKRSHGYPDLGQYHLYAYGAPVTKDWDLDGKSAWYLTRYWNVPWASHVAGYPLNYATDEVCKLVVPVLNDSDVFFTGAADAVHVDYGRVTAASGVYRNYLLVKSGSNRITGVPYFVVFDDAPANRELLQTCYAVANNLSREGDTFRFTGPWGVDYEVHYLSGEVDDGEPWLEAYFTGGGSPPFRWRPDISMVGRNSIRKTPNLGGWTWVGYPRRDGMSNLTAVSSPVVTASGSVLQRVDVTVGATEDVVLVASSRVAHDYDDVRFTGRYGVRRFFVDENAVTLTCLGGGSITDTDYHVGYEGGNASITFTDTVATGDVSGLGGVVRIGRPGFGDNPRGIEVNGENSPFWLIGDTAHVKIAPGTYNITMGIGEADTVVTVRFREPLPFRIEQNAPNPFNPSTRVHYSIPATTHITLTVWTVTGQRVRTLVSGTVVAGSYEAVWDGRDDSGREVGSGVYILRLERHSPIADARSLRMTLIR